MLFVVVPSDFFFLCPCCARKMFLRGESALFPAFSELACQFFSWFVVLTSSIFSLNFFFFFFLPETSSSVIFTKKGTRQTDTHTEANLFIPSLSLSVYLSLLLLLHISLCSRSLICARLLFAHSCVVVHPPVNKKVQSRFVRRTTRCSNHERPTTTKTRLLF